MKRTQSPNTSWQPVNRWYNQSVGKDGHYFHQQIVLPNSLRLLNLNENDKILDVGCGQGVLSRKIFAKNYYQGIDISTDLIRSAKEMEKSDNHHFAVGDATKRLPIQKADFTKAAIILALQNMAEPSKAIANIAAKLTPNGKLLIVLNHPAFRIPRQSSWGIDEAKKTQYRRLDLYMSDLKIPITANPSQRNSEVTWSFHHPISAYTEILRKNGFMIEAMEEWMSDKSSEGKAAKMENRSREEFPLFLAILAVKKK